MTRITSFYFQDGMIYYMRRIPRKLGKQYTRLNQTTYPQGDRWFGQIFAMTYFAGVMTMFRYSTGPWSP